MKITLKLVVLLFTYICHAQDDDIPKNILPSSPDVAGLYKYVATPVSYYSGIPSVNIPLYEMTGVEGGMNVNLSYHSGGIKVSDESGSVGLGWSLNAGGMITRSISNIDDFEGGYLIEENSIAFGNIPMPDAPLMDGKIAERYIKRSSDCYFLVNGEERFFPEMNANDIDTGGGVDDWSPDTFYFNFNGYSGKFWMDQSGDIIKTDQNNGLKVHMIGFGSGFKIITPEGIKYEFNEKEIGNAFLKRAPWKRSDYVSSWLLTKVTDTKGQAITFTYGLESGIRLLPSFSQSFYPNFYGGSPGLVNKASEEVIIYSKYLTNIESSKEKIDFNYSENLERKDIKKAYFLKSIEIYNTIESANQKIKYFDFEYSYFGRESYTKDLMKPTSSNDYYFLTFSDSHPFLRLKLDKVIENNVKEYGFNYFATNIPNEAPSKTSFSQDYWGFYNGQKNNKTFIPTFMNPEIIVPYIGNLTLDYQSYDLANRSPNEDYAKTFLLKTIHYPTKGSTTFDYESNTFYGDINDSGYIFPTNENTKTKKVFCSLTDLDLKEETFTVNDDNVTAKINFDCAVFKQSSKGFYNVISGNVYAEIIDSSGRRVEGSRLYSFKQLYYDKYGEYGHGVENSSVTGFSAEDNILLEKGEEYTLRCYAFEDPSFRSQATISIKWIETQLDNPSLSSINSGGGLRVKSITDHDSENNISLKREFGYHYIEDDEEKSYGKTIKFPKFSTYEYLQYSSSNNFGTPIEPAYATFYKHLSPVAKASSQPAITPFQSSYVGYSQVSESYISTKNSERNGQTIYKYHNDIDNEQDAFYPQEQYKEAFEQFFPNRNPINGLLYEKQHFKSGLFDDFVLQKQENYEYSINGINAFNFNLYNVYNNENFILGGYLLNVLNTNPYLTESYSGVGAGILGNATIINPCDGDYFMFYPYYSHLTQKTSEVVTDYDENGENPVATTITYGYGNANIPTTPTSTKITNSKGELIETKTYYPDDVDLISSLGADNLSSQEFLAINRLKSNGNECRIGQPIQQETKVNGELISIQRTNFSTKNGITLPANIEAAIDGSDLEERLTYHSYTLNGKPQEISTPNGMHITYIWGYNDQYPIAKIENATYADLDTTFLTNLKDLSDIDDDRTIDIVNSNGSISYQGKEGTLRTNLNSIRGLLPNAMVTTYTYDPLVGVTSITDPKRYTMYYEYDDFQRLETVKDAEGNLLSTNDYNYKTN